MRQGYEEVWSFTGGAVLATIPCVDTLIPAIHPHLFILNKDNLYCAVCLCPHKRCTSSLKFWQYKAQRCPDEEAFGECNSLWCPILGRCSQCSQDPRFFGIDECNSGLSLDTFQNSSLGRVEEEGWKHDNRRPVTCIKWKVTAFSGHITLEKKRAVGLTGGDTVDGGRQHRWRETQLKKNLHFWSREYIHGIQHVIFAQLNTHQQQAVGPTTTKWEKAVGRSSP